MSNTLFKSGDILFGKLRPYLNKWWLADKDGIKSGEIWAFLCHDGYSNKFVYSVIQSQLFLSKVNVTSGTKMPRADWKTVSQIQISTPTIQEQTAIGNFFRQLDAAIASHQRKPVLQKASKIKQADTISACFWLAKSSQMPHHNIGILIFKFLNNMNISVLRGGHARMPEPSRHAGNRYPGKKQ